MPGPLRVLTRTRRRPGCCGRIGCEGSGRGPPIGGCGRGPWIRAAPARRRTARTRHRRAGGRDARRARLAGGPQCAGRAAAGIAGRSTLRRGPRDDARRGRRRQRRCRRRRPLFLDAQAERRRHDAGRAAAACEPVAARRLRRRRGGDRRLRRRQAAVPRPARAAAVRRATRRRRLRLSPAAGAGARLGHHGSSTARRRLDGGGCGCSDSARDRPVRRGFDGLDQPRRRQHRRGGLRRLRRLLRGRAPSCPSATGVSAKMSPVGSWMLRCFARRSTNWRATTSSIVLDALFTSMP